MNWQDLSRFMFLVFFSLSFLMNGCISEEDSTEGNFKLADDFKGEDSNEFVKSWIGTFTGQGLTYDHYNDRNFSTSIRVKIQETRVLFIAVENPNSGSIGDPNYVYFGIRVPFNEISSSTEIDHEDNGAFLSLSRIDNKLKGVILDYAERDGEKILLRELQFIVSI